MDIARPKSRRDETLLTVEFILRNMDAVIPKVPQGRHFGVMVVSSLRDFGFVLHRLSRRLKSTVNNVLSLRDKIANSQNTVICYLFFMPKYITFVKKTLVS